MLGIGSAVVKGAGGIMGAIGANSNARAEARAQNEALRRQYKQRLKIRDADYKYGQMLYQSKIGNYYSQVNAADRAASRAYGIEQLKQSQRLKKATLTSFGLNRAFAQQGGAAAAAGKTGRSAERLDLNFEKKFVEGQNMMALNLLEGDIAQQYRQLGIEDRRDSFVNRAFSDVALAPMKPREILEPQQYSGPNNAGMMLGIGTSVMNMASGIAGAFPQNP